MLWFQKYHQAAQLITTLENILLQTIGCSELPSKLSHFRNKQCLAAFDLEIKIPHTIILSKPQTIPEVAKCTAAFLLIIFSQLQTVELLCSGEQRCDGGSLLVRE